MLGEVKFFSRDKGYGFIIDELGSDRFFHQRNISGKLHLRRGLPVTFHPYEEPQGPAASSIRLVSGIGDKDFFQELVEWKMEAKLEDSQRYFFHTQYVDKIESGSRCFVIGRKGTGKTAICEHLYAMKSAEVFCKKLTFKSFPFNDLYELANDRYTSPNQYITLWAYLIYSAVALMMIEDELVDPVIKEKLDAVYGRDVEETLQRKIARWTSRSFHLSILGTGVGASRDRQNESNEASWMGRVELLESIIREYAGSSNYLIVFDELDEDYKFFSTFDQREQYNSLLTSLFKAVLNVKSAFRDSRRKINPVVFLRDDIFDQLKDSDRTKWKDLSVELKWPEARIKNLIAFRISRALSANPKEGLLSFDEAWAKIFPPRPMGFLEGESTSTFHYIAKCTHLRPRDFVRFLKESSTVLLDGGAPAINGELIRSIESEYSKDFRGELEDEMQGLIPEIREVMNVLSFLGKEVFKAHEFAKFYKKIRREKSLPGRHFREVLRTLFDFSVLGNQTRRGKWVFRYIDKNAQCNMNSSFCIHRGLLRALQL